MRTDQLVFERYYDAPISKVWKAITDKKQMKEWYFDLSGFKAEPGYEFTFVAGEKGNEFLHKCKVIDVIPVKKLSYTWRYDGFPGDSVVTFELQPESESRTKLTLTHTGLASFTPDRAEFDSKNFTFGWESLLGDSLRNFVETGSFTDAVSVQASPEKVWNVLVNPNHQWANAFGGGARANTDWNEGSPITWTDENGTVGARGIIQTKEINRKLAFRYYDEAEPAPGDALGDYVESMELQPAGDAGVSVVINIGPFARKYVNMHTDMWSEALKMIKTLAEKQA